MNKDKANIAERLHSLRGAEFTLVYGEKTYHAYLAEADINKGITIKDFNADDPEEYITCGNAVVATAIGEYADFCQEMSTLCDMIESGYMVWDEFLDNTTQGSSISGIGPSCAF